MRVFEPGIINEIRTKRGMTFGDFMRAITIESPKYGLKPTNNQVRNIINGDTAPRPTYLALIADVLKCSVDDFFVTGEPEDSAEEN